MVAAGAVVVAFGALILFGRRSETICGLRGDGRDERFHQIDVSRPDRRAYGHNRDHRGVGGRPQA